MDIDILLKERKNYSFESCAAQKVRAIFERMGISSNIFCLSDGILGDYLMKARSHPPDWTLSFSDLLPQQKPFCDIVQVPHFFWVEDSFAPAAHYLNSKYAKIGVRDRSLHSFQPNVHFLPYGVETTCCDKESPLFDVVYFADLADREVKERTWRELFSDQAVELIKTASSSCRQNRSLNPFISIVSLIKDPEQLSQISMHDLIYGVEEYLKAERAYQLISSFEGIRLDVFGEHVGKNWFVRLKNSEWIYLHGPLPFSEHSEVLKRSRIVIFDHFESKEECDPWFLEALAAGCLPLTNKTPYLEELVSDSPIFYKDPQELLRKIEFYLKFPEKREELVHTLAETILRNHSWEKRTQELIELLQ